MTPEEIGTLLAKGVDMKLYAFFKYNLVSNGKGGLTVKAASEPFIVIPLPTLSEAILRDIIAFKSEDFDDDSVEIVVMNDLGYAIMYNVVNGTRTPMFYVGEVQGGEVLEDSNQVTH